MKGSYLLIAVRQGSKKDVKQGAGTPSARAQMFCPLKVAVLFVLYIPEQDDLHLPIVNRSPSPVIQATPTIV